MSNAAAIAGVTAVLEYLLTNVYSGAQLGSVSVSAVAPDLVHNTAASGPDSGLQVNLFLHQVTLNAAWRNVGQPSVAPDGTTRLKNPPLALDLHYLLTAYGSMDCEAEALLGFAVRMLHDTPVVPRSQIALGLGSLPNSNPVAKLLGPSGLADQIEMIKITPATLGREELAWLWTALKADYRPTFPFQVSVVLIEPQFPTMVGPPVLSRDITVQAGSPPLLLGAAPPPGQAAAGPGDTVTVTGQALSGANQVSLTNQRLGSQYPPFAPVAVSDSTASFKIPNDPANLPAGLYNLSMLFTAPGGKIIQSTNSVPVAVAPTIATPAPTVVPNAAGLLVTVHCNPEVLPNQTVSFALGQTMAPAQSFDALTAVVTFQFPPLASGSYLARLRVDGVESPVNVNWLATPPVFTGPWVTV
jgi:Pvc16 N-terminal domain